MRAVSLLWLLAACACAPAEKAAQRLPDWPRIAFVQDARRGDRWTLQHPGVYAEIGALSSTRAPGQLLTFGSAAGSTAPLLTGVAFSFEQSGATLPMRLTQVTPVTHGDRAALGVVGEVLLGARWVGFERRLTAGDVAGTLSVSTRIDAPAGAVSLVERLGWGETRAWLPGVGRPLDDTPGDVEWVGAEAASQALVVGPARGVARAQAVFDEHGPHRFMRAIRLVSAGAPAPAAQATAFKSLIVQREASLGQTLRAFGWSRGRPFAELLASLASRPPQTAVRVAYDDGRPYLRTTPSQDTALLIPLPGDAEVVQVQVSAFGHAASAPLAVSLREPGPRVRLELPSSGELQLRVREARTGRELPFRMRLLGIEGTATPSLGPDRTAAGALDVAMGHRGKLTTEVPPGTYQMLVSHGPEWSLEERRVQIVAGRTTRLQLALEHQAPAPGWLGCDLHVHAAPSPDSDVALDDRLRSLAAEGVAFAVPTDHNHVTDYGPGIEAGGFDLRSLPGVEVTTETPAFGHFNAFPFPRDAESESGGAPAYVGRAPEELFASLHALDPALAVQVNHPRLEGGIGYFDQSGFDPVAGTSDGSYSDAYDLIEVWNGYDIARPAAVQRNFDEWLAMLATRPHVATGSSDSHSIRNAFAGYPRTYVYAGEEPPADLREVIASLKAGRVFVTNGPILLTTLDGKGPGERVASAGAPMLLKIQVRTSDWVSIDRIEVYQGAQVVRTFAIDAGARGQARRVSRSLVLERRPGTWTVVVVRGSRGLDTFYGRKNVLPLAFTNPIWID